MAVTFMQMTEVRTNKASLSPLSVENELAHPNYFPREDGDFAVGARPWWVTQRDHDDKHYGATVFRKQRRRRQQQPHVQRRRMEQET